MKNSKVRFIAYSAMIAAAYVALTMISAAFGLSSGAIQVRISEALCVLPIFTLSAVPGVTVGCFIANILCGVVFFRIAVFFRLVFLFHNITPCVVFTALLYPNFTHIILHISFKLHFQRKIMQINLILLHYHYCIFMQTKV